MGGATLGASRTSIFIRALQPLCAILAAQLTAGSMLQASAERSRYPLAPPSEVIVGDIRVQALSSTLLRVEPRGPQGFEDRTTFMVTGRNWTGIPITKEADGTLSTASWNVAVGPTTEGSAPSIVVTGKGGTVLYNSSAARPTRAHPDGPVPSPCDGLTETYCTQPKLSPRQPAHWVCLWDRGKCSELNQETKPNLLHWPAPLTSSAYALTDYPRFYVPQWDLKPAPETVEPELRATNGYDFRNNVEHDTYIFLLGDTLPLWRSSRQEFIELAGETPVLPDFAFGTWFTWWHPFSMDDAQSNVTRWENGQLPLDIWALDMNWRHTEAVQHGAKAQKGQAKGELGTQDHYYDHPNEQLFPGDGPYGSSFTEWFNWLKSKKLRTYFNDHPYPVAGRNEGGLQTSPEEVEFRWEGLTSWMSRGLTYWWFDHNWKLSIPPPFINKTLSTYVWEGLDNAAWGSHLYYTTVAHYDEMRSEDGDTFYERPIALTKFALPDWRPGMDPIMHQESPAHHRYPVWWTGDGVPLQGSIESMVDSGVHGMKPYVHSDCGGDYAKNGGDLLRWTAHCVFGTILRYHGADHRPWRYGSAVETTIQKYINIRYKLAPSLIAAGQEASRTGTPFVARCDLFWPEYGHVPRESRNCSKAMLDTDAGVGAQRAATMPPKGNLSQASCCEYCVADPTCSAYVWATDGVQQSGYSCWLLQSTGGTRRSASRILGLVGAQKPVMSSSSSTQYIFLNDTLVAPIWDTSTNGTTRSVWIPPGKWEDAWTGSIVSGPQTIQSEALPYEKQPMYHKRDGGLNVITDSPGLRIEDGDWSSLTLEAFPAQTAMETRRSVYHQNRLVLQHHQIERTDLVMRTDGLGKACFEISEATDNSERAWVIRLHLQPKQRVVEAVIDGINLIATAIVHLAPLSEAETTYGYFPFGGVGSQPPVKAGHIAEFTLVPAAHARLLSLTIASQLP
eukprot:SAG11_NODE_998_length_6237_cov_22.378299_4_plen_957_part_00